MGFVRMSEDQFLTRIATAICGMPQRAKRIPLTVMIDGKAASGKSTLVREITARLAKRRVKVCSIEADWYLLSRSERQEKEKDRLREVCGHVYIPEDLHLSYWRRDGFRDALDRVRTAASQKRGGRVELTGLYNRATGKCSEARTLTVPPGAVIIVEGCYLLAQDLRPDISILLYVNREIGRARKIQREEEKSEGEFPTGERVGTVITTWEQIEEPTFFRHLMEHGSKAHVVIDTSDVKSMAIIKYRLPGQTEDDLEKAVKWDEQVSKASGDAKRLLALAREAPGDSDYVRVMLLRGELLKGQRKYSEALSAFKAALKKAPHDVRALTQKALMLQRLGQSDKALEALDRAAQSLDGQSTAGLWHGEIEGIRGRILKSAWKEKWFARTTPEERWRCASQEISQLVAALRVYAAMFRRDPTSYFNGDNAAALASLYRHLMSKSPPMEPGVAQFWQEPEDLLSATRWAAQAARANDEHDFWARSTLGNIALMEGRKDHAIAEYTNALRDCSPAKFAVNSVAEQLELFEALGFREGLCQKVLAILAPYR